MGGKYPLTTVDGSEIRRENHPTGMKPMVNNEIFIRSTGERRIFWAIRSSLFHSIDSFHFFHSHVPNSMRNCFFSYRKNDRETIYLPKLILHLTILLFRRRSNCGMYILGVCVLKKWPPQTTSRTKGKFLGFTPRIGKDRFPIIHVRPEVLVSWKVESTQPRFHVGGLLSPDFLSRNTYVTFLKNSSSQLKMDDWEGHLSRK